MDGISVHWKDVDLLVVVTDSLSNKRSSTSNMSKKRVENILTFSVNSLSKRIVKVIIVRDYMRRKHSLNKLGPLTCL